MLSRSVCWSVLGSEKAYDLVDTGPSMQFAGAD